jgi:transcriptional regulator with XRE-family HTH domain
MRKAIVTSGEIGAVIRRRRKELGISQEQLAEMLGVSYQQVQRYESGFHKLNIENIQVVADALSVPVAEFFKPEVIPKVAETPPPYQSSDENKLVKLFRKIKTREARTTILRVARLALRAERM